MQPFFRLNYATTYEGQGVHLRPFMLCWRADAGCSGFIEPEVAATMMELMMSEGFLLPNQFVVDVGSPLVFFSASSEFELKLLSSPS